MKFKKAVKSIAGGIAELLYYKNEKYGNAALSPKNTFSKADAADSILIRIDDKIARIANSDELRKNDVVDLIGYLILLCVVKDWLTFDEFKD